MPGKRYTVEGQLQPQDKQAVQTERFLGILRARRKEIIELVYGGQERHVRGANWQYSLTAQQIKAEYRKLYPGKQPSRGTILAYMAGLRKNGHVRARPGYRQVLYFTTIEGRDLAAMTQMDKARRRQKNNRLARLRYACPDMGPFKHVLGCVLVPVKALDQLLDLANAPSTSVIEGS